jgi:hypothetical protein
VRQVDVVATLDAPPPTVSRGMATRLVKDRQVGIVYCNRRGAHEVCVLRGGGGNSGTPGSCHVCVCWWVGGGHPPSPGEEGNIKGKYCSVSSGHPLLSAGATQSARDRQVRSVL